MLRLLDGFVGMLLQSEQSEEKRHIRLSVSGFNKK